MSRRQDGAKVFAMLPGLLPSLLGANNLEVRTVEFLPSMFGVTICEQIGSVQKSTTIL